MYTFTTQGNYASLTKSLDPFTHSYKLGIYFIGYDDDDDNGDHFSTCIKGMGVRNIHHSSCMVDMFYRVIMSSGNVG